MIFNLFFINKAIADNDDQKSDRLHIINGRTLITLDTKAQELSGIETTLLKPASHHAEFITYGKAISIQPLLALRHRYLVAQTERERVGAKFKLAEQAIKRQQDLYQYGVTAKRNLQDQQAQWQTDKALFDAMHFQERSIADEALLNWGKTLAEWVLTKSADKLSVFLNGQQTLLQITLPTDHPLANDIQAIYVEPSGNRGKAQKAELISAAPQADVLAQGSRYFYQTDSKTIKTGMNVSAWLPEQPALNGVIIPKSAVCWAMDQAFIYLKIDNVKFSRMAINHYSTTSDGYFMSHTLQTGQEIVVKGAQMLLSEELRGQIPELSE